MYSNNTIETKMQKAMTALITICEYFIEYVCNNIISLPTIDYLCSKIASLYCMRSVKQNCFQLN